MKKLALALIFIAFIFAGCTQQETALNKKEVSQSTNGTLSAGTVTKNCTATIHTVKRKEKPSVYVRSSQPATEGETTKTTTKESEPEIEIFDQD